MSEYVGTDNLEVMTNALNYNKYLLGLVTSFTGKASNIVDFGAGIGTFANAMKQNGFPVHCIEPDSHQRKLIEHFGLTTDASLASISQHKIDYLYSLNVLEHIQNDKEILCQIYEALEPGGQVLIYVPAFQILFSSMDRKVGHFRRYSKKELIDKLTDAQFMVEKARYVDCAGFFVSILFRWIGDSSGKINVGSLIFYDRIIFPLSRLCDFFCQYFFGKNVWVLARKPVQTSFQESDSRAFLKL